MIERFALHTNDANPGWTDDRVKLLRQYYADGLSHSVIAAKIGGGITRNAVIGKAHRIGLPGRLTGRVRPPRPTLFYSRPKSLQLPLPLEPQTPCDPISLLDIKERMCRWPIDDPRSADFRFCGQTCEGAYCSQHAAIAYRPVKRRRAA